MTGIGIVAQAILIGVLVLLAGTIPRNILFAANLRYYPVLPWAVPLTALYVWCFWRYLQGGRASRSAKQDWRSELRAGAIAPEVWAWALLAGGAGIVALVLALRIANRLVVLPLQQLPDLSSIPAVTIVGLLLMAAPVAGIVEEAAFRGYMQGPIERRYGLIVAILITGTMFAIVHLDFTLILWPYYVAVAAIYGTVTYLAKSILPAIALHTGGNLYSNFDLWLHGQAEWQAAGGPAALVWTTGADALFWMSTAGLVVAATLAMWSYVNLARVTRTVLP
jgi:membrane protease YdiL (CAAX protease family)